MQFLTAMHAKPPFSYAIPHFSRKRFMHFLTSRDAISHFYKCIFSPFSRKIGLLKRERLFFPVSKFPSIQLFDYFNFQKLINSKKKNQGLRITKRLLVMNFHYLIL